MTEPLRGRILVVDADYDSLGVLSAELRKQGHHVVLAADGRAGLQRAVEVAPDVVLVDREVPVVDVRTFFEVLRNNPRTSGAHVFVMGTGDPGRLASFDSRAEPIVKPFNAAEVTARVAEVLRTRLGPRPEPELRGDLEQFAIQDLLQVFAANRRTGKLTVTGRAAMGEVWVHEGRIVDATYAGVVGEKALYRVLQLAEGRFVFAPGLRPDRERIGAATDHLLMEAARQQDEGRRLRGQLPPSTSLIGRARAPDPGNDLGERVLSCLDEPRTIDELLDVVPAGDLDILGAIRDLLASGALIAFDPRGERARLCEPEGIIGLRAAAARLRRPGLDGAARIGVISSSAADVARFGRALSSVDEFVAAAQPPTGAGAGVLGPLGLIRLDGMDLELFALPMDPSLRPTWGPLLAPSRVAIVLVDGPVPEDVVELLQALAVRPVAAPPGWGRPAGAAAAVNAALAPPSSLTQHPSRP